MARDLVVDVPENVSLIVRCDAEFYVYQRVAGEDGVKEVLMGPDSAVQRVLRVPPLTQAWQYVCRTQGQCWFEMVPGAARVEMPDPRPVEVPLGYERPLSLQEEMRRMIREEVSRAAVEQGSGSFEEEDDFEEEDPDLLQSPYELTDMQADFDLPAEAAQGGLDAVEDEGEGKVEVPEPKPPLEAEVKPEGPSR